jgi:ribonuclease J
LHTSNGSIGYTADIRFHGRRELDTKRFVEKCKNSHIKLLLCEGTRINEDFSKTERDVEDDVKTLTYQTRGLVICTYPRRDLDRMLSFYNAAKESERNLVIDMKQAYLLKLFQTSESLKELYPKPNDKDIKIHIPRKLWGLLYKDIDLWTKKQLLADYERWEEEFLDYPNKIDCRDIFAHQNELIFYCNDFQLPQLIDIRPDVQSSSYIRSFTEPFDEEMELEERRIKRWLAHFGLLADENSQWHQTHFSGHGSGDQIRKIIQDSTPSTLVPIHTEHEEYYKKWHNNVIQVPVNGSSIELH